MCDKAVSPFYIRLTGKESDMMKIILVVLILTFVTLAFIRSAALADRQYEELVRKKFFGEDGNGND